jgi:hypothetical protein
MPRTSTSAVKETVDTSLSDTAIDDWIAVAGDLVDDIEDRSSLSDGRLARIERLVAQHFLSAQDQRHSSVSGPSRSAEYQGETGKHFEGTKHGQRALALDPTGVLANANEPDDFTLSI